MSDPFPIQVAKLLETGTTLAMEGRDDEAIERFMSALMQDENSLLALLRLGELNLKKGRFHDMERFAARAVALDGKQSIGRIQLAVALAGLGNLVQARDQLKIALELSSASAAALNGIGVYLLSQGRFADAAQLYSVWIEAQPVQSSAYLGLFQSGRVELAHEEYIQRAKLLCDQKALSGEELWPLRLAIGKALDDLGQYREAMEQFDEAHRVALELPATPMFDRQGYQAAVDRIQGICSESLMSQSRRLGLPTAQPIFVVGMLRSGTTLTEQILTCHSQIGGAGEQGFLFDFKKPGAFTLKALEGFSPEGLKHKAIAYLENLNRTVPNSPRIIDKFPGNAQVAGLIHLAFPNAKIINILRNPVDTCLSIWTTPNASPPPWSHNKGDIVFAYRSYQNLTALWRGRIPGSAYAEYHYEDLVNKTEGTVRSMLEFCELPWDEACLRHNQNPRSVMTPSVWQVRQPIYRSSLHRRENYRDCLGQFAHLAEE